MTLEAALFYVLIGAVPALLFGIAIGHMARDDQINRQVMPPEDWPDETLTPDMFEGMDK